jgi:hypothetical protein
VTPAAGSGRRQTRRKDKQADAQTPAISSGVTAQIGQDHLEPRSSEPLTHREVCGAQRKCIMYKLPDGDDGRAANKPLEADGRIRDCGPSLGVQWTEPVKAPQLEGKKAVSGH